MPRRPATFTQADVARALRAIKAAGVTGWLEIKPDGSIHIHFGERSPDVRPAVEPRQEVVLW